MMGREMRKRAQAQRPRILVVDDDVTVRAMAEYHLSESGCDVLALSDGSSVVEKFIAYAPDLILLDVLLPDADGYAICRELRALPGAEHVPIVMLTSLSEGDAVCKAFDAGATEFVEKPVNWLNESYRVRYLMRAALNKKELDRSHMLVFQAKQQWEQTFDAIDDPILLLSPDLVISRANAATARLTGRSLPDLIGVSCYDVFNCKKDQCEECCAQKAAISLRTERAEVIGHGAENRVCLASASPVLDSEKKLTGIVYALRDITDFRELEREFLHAQKVEALGVLAGGIAHDFNNLLQAIMGFAELYGSGDFESSELRKGLMEIHKVSERGQSLTRQLLLSSRKASAPFAPVNVGSMVTHTLEIFRRTLPRTLEMDVDISKNLWMVSGDESHLQQTVMNLVINASQAMPDGGLLNVYVGNAELDEADCRGHHDCRPGRYVWIDVSDTGCGMSAKTMQSMYDPFYTTKPPGEGTGLGLSVVFGIIQAHGGHINCSSEIGHGTTFSIYLPAIAAQAVKSKPADLPQNSCIAGDNQFVMLVEDDSVIQRLVMTFLENNGYQVLPAMDGIEALELFDSHRKEIAAVIMDMNMPRMNGETCMKELSSRGCDVPILLATGTLFGDDRQDELLQFAHQIIVKPYKINTLMQQLGRAIAETKANDTA